MLSPGCRQPARSNSPQSTSKAPSSTETRLPTSGPCCKSWLGCRPAGVNIAAETKLPRSGPEHVGLGYLVAVVAQIGLPFLSGAYVRERDWACGGRWGNRKGEGGEGQWRRMSTVYFALCGCLNDREVGERGHEVGLGLTVLAWANPGLLSMSTVPGSNRRQPSGTAVNGRLLIRGSLATSRPLPRKHRFALGPGGWALWLVLRCDDFACRKRLSNGVTASLLSPRSRKAEAIDATGDLE